MPKANNYWSKNRRGGNGGNNNNQNNSAGNSNNHNKNSNNHGEKGGQTRDQANHNTSNNNHHGREGQQQNQQHGAQQGKRATPCVRSRSELRRILHDKLEWNEKTTTLDLTLLVCADESDPAEAELIVVSAGCVSSTTRYVRSDIVEAQKRRREKEAREMEPDCSTRGVLIEFDDEDTQKMSAEETKPSCEDCSGPGAKLPTTTADELFRFDPSSKTHKCKVLNQIARSVQKAWCGLLFVPAYQLGQATSFIRALNPKPDFTHYVDGYISRLCCLEDLLWALRSARGLLNVEPPLAYSIWHSMREEDMAQLSEYSELTCTCVIATLHERAQTPPSLLAVSELWPSVVVPPRHCQPPRLPWATAAPEATPIDDLFNDDL